MALLVGVIRRHPVEALQRPTGCAQPAAEPDAEQTPEALSEDAVDEEVRRRTEYDEQVRKMRCVDDRVWTGKVRVAMHLDDLDG